jgi:pimeloyl-ACP methyl ester carboxylesterase
MSERKKKMTGRQTWPERAAARVLAVLQQTAPPLAERLAEALFFTPPREKASARARASAEDATPFRVPFGGHELPAWRWGAGPTALLVHGWGSRGLNMAPFVPSLRAAGFSVVAYDAPAHGAAPGRRASIPQMAAALQAVARAAGTVDVVVAHSIGASVVAFALRDGLSVRRVALIAPPADPDGFTQGFARRLRLREATVEGMKRRAERRLRRSWSDFDLRPLVAGFTAPLLVVHDQGDAEVPWSGGQALAAAWPGATLVTTAGLGHRRILKDGAVVERVVRFLATRDGPHDRTCAHGRAADGHRCPACTLEADLFNRDARRARAR